jgi:hypothetical protein
MPRQSAVAKNVSIVPSHRKHGDASTAWLQRNDRALLSGQRLGHVQEFEDLNLTLPQLLTEFGTQHSGRRAAS